MSTPPAASPSVLPYTDTKPVGSPDFYYGINSTFKFILAKLGTAGWVRYLEDMAREYHAPANARWKAGGLPAVAAYWRAFFAAEPGSQVSVSEAPGRVKIEVKVCPALKHLKAGGRKIAPEFCRHCYHMGNARAATAGMAMRLEGGNGSCTHTYYGRAAEAPPQDLARIKEVSS